MAEGILKTRLEEAGVSGIEVQSAGTHGGHIPLPSPEAVDVCAEMGIDIASHLSRPLTAEMMDWADLVLYMDLAHEGIIDRAFAEFSRKSWPITAFREDRLRNGEIPDPYGMPISYYRRTFELLDGSLNPVASALAAHHAAWVEQEVDDAT